MSLPLLGIQGRGLFFIARVHPPPINEAFIVCKRADSGKISLPGVIQARQRAETRIYKHALIRESISRAINRWGVRPALMYAVPTTQSGCRHGEGGR